MGLKDLFLKHSYSKGINNEILKDFVIPSLKESNRYYRSVGYFSCKAIIELASGVEELMQKDGIIKVVTSPNLSEEDIKLISEGYEQRKKILTNSVLTSIHGEFLDDLEFVSEDIIKMIRDGKLDIKIVIGNNYGLYHDKVGFFRDENNDTVCFVGSANETYSAYHTNYEKVRVYCSWKDETSNKIVYDELDEFDRIWDNKHNYLDTYDFTDSMREGLIKKIEEHNEGISEKPSDNVNLRPYQIKAISKWVENNYNGFYEMATGTGKTFTAIYSIKRLFEEMGNIFVTIVAPYKHLIEQWYSDLLRVFPDTKILRISSDHPHWESHLRTIVNTTIYAKIESKVIVLITKSSYTLDRYRKHAKRLKMQNLIVVDEAHRFYNEIWKTDLKYDYKLGLSATPYFKDQNKTKELIKYFEKVVFRYSLEEAIGKYLVEYKYTPYFVNLSNDEEKQFSIVQSKIASCFRNGTLVKEVEILGKYIRMRNKIIARCAEKEQEISNIINNLEQKDHFIIYCGDGYYESLDGKDDLRYIDNMTKQIHNLNIRAHKFTASETIHERMELIEDFTSGMVDVMVAIKCLDEGVNVPSIKTALLLANNDDSREFIQRRGRILRKYKGKDFAEIIDVIVLPNSDKGKKVAEIELRRFFEFAKLSFNKKENLSTLNELLEKYNLTKEEVQFQNNIDELWEVTDE